MQNTLPPFDELRAEGVAYIPWYTLRWRLGLVIGQQLRDPCAAGHGNGWSWR